MQRVRFRRACALGSGALLGLRLGLHPRRAVPDSERHALGWRGPGLPPRLQVLALWVCGPHRGAAAAGRSRACRRPGGADRPLPKKALPQRDAAAAQPRRPPERLPPGLRASGGRVAEEPSLPVVVLRGGVQGAGLGRGRPPPRARPFAARGQCLQVSLSRVCTRDLARQRTE